jgi:hypothetical protein
MADRPSFGNSFLGEASHLMKKKKKGSEAIHSSA